MRFIRVRQFMIVCLLLVVAGCVTTIKNVRFVQGLDAKEAGQYEKAFELLLPVAEDDSFQFSGTAKYAIAEQLELGQGVTQNMEAAINWYKRAAADSDETTANLARYHLGYLYSQGSKVPKNLTEAFKWLDAVTGSGEQKSLALQQKTLALTAAARGYEDEKKYDRAIEAREKAIKFYEQQGNRDEIAQLRLFIAGNYRDQGNHSKAISNYVKASDLYKSIGKLPEAGEMLWHAGVVQVANGQYEDAINTYNESLRLTRNSEDKSKYISALSGIAGVYFAIGKFDKAFEYKNEAFRVSRQIQNPKEIANIYHGLAVTLKEWGQYDKALQVLEDGLDKLKRAPIDHEFPSLARDFELAREFDKSLFHNAISQIFLEIQKPDEAKPHIDQTLKISRHLFKSEVTTTLLDSSLASLGDYYQLKEDFDSAEKSYNEALALQSSEVGINKIGILAVEANINQSLGALHFTKGNFETAIRHLQNAIDINSKLQRPQRLVINLRGMGLIYGKLRKFKEAIDYYEAALRLTEELRTTASGIARADYLANTLSVYQNLSILYLLEKNPLRALEVTEQARAKLLSEKILKTTEPVKAFKIENFLDDTHPDDAVLIFSNVEWDTPMAYLLRSEGLGYQSILRAGNLDPVYATFKNEAEELFQNLSGFEVDEQQSIESQADRTVKRSKIRKLINYYRYLLSNPLAKVESPSVAGLQDLGGSKNAMKKSTVEDPRRARLVQLGKALYNLLIKPVEKNLIGKQQLVIVPDGVLAFLPFETLIDNDGRYLIEKFDIRYASSLTVRNLILKRSYSDKRRPIAAFGGAVYSAKNYVADIIKDKIELAALSRGAQAAIFRGERLDDQYARLGVSNWTNLPGTVQEVRDIVKIFGDADSYVGEEASEDTVKKLSEQGTLSEYRILHFATHGITLPQIPELSALVLSQNSEAKSREDGYLTISEIAKLKLNADYVVLSACQTGLGKLFRGEGIYGLTQAFIVAGANAVSVSLWNVADKSTAIFMGEFYKTGKERALSFYKSLSETKRQFIQGKFGKAWQDPFFWAPFVQYGES